MDPMTLVALLGPSVLNFLGGLMDDSDEGNLKLNRDILGEKKREFNLSLPLQQASTSADVGGYLSRLLAQRQGMADRTGLGAGFGAASGMRY